MKIALGSDHGGFQLKRSLIDYLKKNGHNIIDVGCFNDESCDYPQYSYEAAAMVRDKIADRAVVICKSGIGNSMVANKVKGVRAALCYNIAQVRSSREPNDANVLALGAMYTNPAAAKRMVSVWLKTKALAGRHARRVRQIKSLEKIS